MLFFKFYGKGKEVVPLVPLLRRGMLQDLDPQGAELQMETENIWGTIRTTVQCLKKAECLVPMLDNLHGKGGKWARSSVKGREFRLKSDPQQGLWAKCCAGLGQRCQSHTPTAAVIREARHCRESNAGRSVAHRTFEEAIILWKLPKTPKCFDTQS